ncbi:MAG: Zn-ribbon domain-containing OB-fold protein [Bacteroidetes bacterium]|nr:Zn-ribbon domain-containing OB-fold protein [Bacteroidota bacterium]
MEVAKNWREQPSRYRLEAVKCKTKGMIFFPKRRICPETGCTDFETIRLKGKGVIETYTIIRTAPSGFEDQAPYAIGIVKLEEGISIMGQITDCDPEKLKVGDKVVTKFRRMNEEGKTGMIQYCYKFVPDVGV